jgi:sigma-B regulation protein RsbU (phosphoserine phosphatase)
MDTALLKHVPLFVSLPPSELADLAASLRESRYSAGVVLFREGEYGDRFYIVLDGQIAIIKALGSDDERLLGLRGAGEFVGEMSLLSQDGRRTASVRVQSSARVLELTRADFDALLHRYPLLAYEMLRVLSIRLRESHDTAIRDLHEKNARLAQAYADLQAAQARIIEQETLERELRLARETQESMLPRALPYMAGLDIGARMVAAHMVGGDFYDVFPLGDDSLGVVIGDVSGKGMPAALFMALVSSLLRAEAQRGDTTPEQALRIVNRHLLSRDARSTFVTVVYGVLCCETREFAFVRAGHEMPLLLGADGALLTPAIGRGHPLGLFPTPMLDVQRLCLPLGSTLLLYTDGVNEAMDANSQLFGSERMVATVRGAREASAQQLCDLLVQVVTEYRGLAAQADDITVLAVRVQ